MRLNHARSGRGEPLVLMHGIGDSLRAWDPVRERLAAHHEAIAVDLPGFGDSRALREKAATPQVIARAVIDFMGGARFHVAGNSLGGGVALEIAKAGHALSVSAFSPVGFASAWERAYLRAALEATRTLGPLMGLRFGTKLPSWLMMDRPRPAAVLRKGLEDLRHAPGWEATVGPTVDYVFEGTLDVPATIAWGEHDKVVLYRQSRRARQVLPQATHVTLRRCGHLPTWDDPDAVAEAILSATQA